MMHQFLQQLAPQKQHDLQEILQLVQTQFPNQQPMFFDGKNKEGKVVTNPSIGFGTYLHRYADGREEPMYRMGFSANTKGISIYLLGLPDRKILIEKFADRIGKAKVTGYCIQFKGLQDLNVSVLKEIIDFGLN
ncbi:MAG: hypothetical protein RLZZ65_1199 [Bacteroidota bacterium]|jgi:uncharacterized protein YdhG (YjbR/CyaY superfamily)